MKSAMTRRPTTASLLDRNAWRKSPQRVRVRTAPLSGASLTWASAILEPHPRIEDRVEHVHQKVDQHEKDRAVEDDALDAGVVSAVDRLEGELPDPVPRK